MWDWKAVVGGGEHDYRLSTTTDKGLVKQLYFMVPVELQQIPQEDCVTDQGNSSDCS